MKLIHPLSFTLLLAIAALLGWAVWQERGARPDETPGVVFESLRSMQDADTPLPLPADGRPRHRLHGYRAWQLATLPVAPRFDPPMGGEEGALTYNAQPFWERNEARGGHHSGDDLNGIGGGNSDLGDPVFAVADGLVVYAGQPTPGWGPIVVVAHRSNDGRLLQSLYAHLQRIEVPLGSLVERGQVIGRVGTANGHYPAHLHFEMRLADGVDIGAGYSMRPLNRLNPEETVASLRGAQAERPAPAMLRAALDREHAWNRLEIEGAERLGE